MTSFRHRFRQVNSVYKLLACLGAQLPQFLPQNYLRVLATGKRTASRQCEQSTAGFKNWLNNEGKEHLSKLAKQRLKRSQWLQRTASR